MVTGQELTGGLMFAIMNPQIELFTESDLALLTFEFIFTFQSHVLFSYMIFESGQLMTGKGALITIVAMT